jgi:hypothetical protein
VDGSAVCNCYWPSPGQSFSGPSPVGLLTKFYCLRFETSLFVASYDSQGYGGGIRPRLRTDYVCVLSLCLSLMLRPTVCRPVSLRIKHPSGAYDKIFYFCLSVEGLLMLGALSDERTGLSFTIVAGPRPRSHSRV